MDVVENEKYLTALDSLKHSNEDVRVEDDLYFPTYFLEVHFSIVFFMQVLFYIFPHALQVMKIPNSLPLITMELI